MANQRLEYLYVRRPPLHYESPAVCVNEFSSTAEPTITLTPFARRRGPSGLIFGGAGNVVLSWDNYPGAICYSVYKAVDEDDPFGEYVLVAECISDAFLDLTPFGPGIYRVSALTPEGESELSDPIVFAGFSGGPVEFSAQDTGLGTTAHRLGENGDVVGVDVTLATPALFRSGKLIRLLTLGGSTGQAADVNVHGVIVGQSSTTGDVSVHVTRWVVEDHGAVVTDFIQPAVGGNVVVDIDSESVVGGDGIWIAGGGTYRVIAIASGMLTLRNLYALNESVGTMIPAGAAAKRIIITDISGATANNPFINDAGKIAYQSTIGTDVSVFTPPAMISHIGKAGAGSSEGIVGFNNGDTIALRVFLPPATTAFAYRWAAGAFTDITPPGGVNARPALPRAIAPGQPFVVGEARFNFDPDNRGWISLGGLGVDIGALGGDFSALTDVNDSGAAVGNAEDGGGAVRAIKYFGGIVNLGAYFVADSDANGINTAGYVMGLAGSDAVVWDPITIPTVLDDLGFGSTAFTHYFNGQQVNGAKQCTAFGQHAVGSDTIALIQLPAVI